MEPVAPPTNEQIRRLEIVNLEGQRWMATWYPQIGGYTGKCWVSLDTDQLSKDENDKDDRCFTCLIWHDGSFPFAEEGHSPVRLHHCSPSQFVRFGTEVKAAQRLHE